MVPALNAAGLNVTSVGSAAEALRLRDSGLHVDAIVSDIEMPDIDGLQFARTLRAGGTWSALPLIALTSHAGAQHEAAGREAGFNGYVAKFEREALIDSLRTCLSETASVLA
jgi:two-component system chemotaxis sensor kinase CheA